MDTPLDIQTELNIKYSSSTAFSTWRNAFHETHMTDQSYIDLVDDCKFMVNQWLNEEGLSHLDIAEEVTIRIIYVVSTAPLDTMSMATLVSKLDTDCTNLKPEYAENIQAYSELVYHLRTVGIFQYKATSTGHPILIPEIAVTGDLATLLSDKFSSALPQLESTTGTLKAKGKGLLPGIRFSGKSTRRKTPLNQQDMKAITLVSQQTYMVDMDIVRNMEYYVPTMTESGNPLSAQEQEDARTMYRRFEDMSEIADELGLGLSMPTSEDSRGRLYNMATDPSIRLSLRSMKATGSLTPFEQSLLNQ